MNKYLFRHLKELEEFKLDKKTALITDIDGTISKIAPTPEQAQISPSMRSILIKLRNKFKLVAFISGRSVFDAQRMVGIDGMLYVGSHGLEYLKNGERNTEIDLEKYLPSLKKTFEEIKTCDLAQIPGIVFEDKQLCLSFHYRQCENPKEVREKIIDALRSFPETKKLQITQGRKVVDIRPPGHDKGLILEKIIQRYQLKKVIYLGDDITDSDAFNKLNELSAGKKIKAVSILVLSSEIPNYIKKSSSFYVEGVDEVQRFFKWLLS
ncbi:MAG: trehalose-phosphatase [Methanobacterium sp.]